ncbi:hypothetical protein CJU13_21325 [Pseudomonas aeruginosa]|nr:hypothetical protein CJU11_20440 [Pseudomonas aeruginosa]PBW35183.1 hypothetical protein CJU13_21325 [Pseudomonas aeruginosa]PBW41652.1 hypothetical protein CJU12_17630 [Pseudomonas aeruginosa]RPN66813.1 hypothetical protein IPC1237_30540 [Pseudomonas aeruginosa]RQD64371.1 hypothetical protein IPC312_09845 [Pseudomonas aeruginosa]
MGSNSNRRGDVCEYLLRDGETNLWLEVISIYLESDAAFGRESCVPTILDSLTDQQCEAIGSWAAKLI